MRKPAFYMCEKKMQINAFVFALEILKSLFLNQKCFKPQAPFM